MKSSSFNNELDLFLTQTSLMMRMFIVVVVIIYDVLSMYYLCSYYL